MADFYIPFQTLSFEYDEQTGKTILTSSLKVDLHLPEEQIGYKNVQVSKDKYNDYIYTIELVVDGSVYDDIRDDYEWKRKIKVADISSILAYDLSSVLTLEEKKEAVRSHIILGLFENVTDEYRVTAKVVYIQAGGSGGTTNNTITNTGAIEITV